MAITPLNFADGLAVGISPDTKVRIQVYVTELTAIAAAVNALGGGGPAQATLITAVVTDLTKLVNP